MPEFLDLHGQTNKVVRALADAALRRHGLHLGQDHLLAALWEQDGQTPGELAAAADVSTPAVVKMADRMSAAGLIQRRRDQHDNRLVRLWLTEKGSALRAPVEAERRELENTLTAGLDDDEKARLLKALRTIRESALALRNSERERTGDAGTE
ncbi:MarR family winged helix-turn-helix transcriptional regulator [Rathayibacter sp. CAU 1779]